ncbi:MAG: B-box zinc finger protein [Terracidiphilus sp.]
MDCVNHPGVRAVVYCQNCGKGMCTDCLVAGAMRNVPGGQILCSTCIDARQSMQPPFASVRPSGPNPAAAALLGLIPGVGAMYNGQFFKGFIHVIVFAVLIRVTNNYPIFGLFIAAWILYQSFEAYHTARALRDGYPPPDPLGLNEVENWLNPGARVKSGGQPGAGQVPGVYPPSSAGQPQTPGQAPDQAPYQQAPFPSPMPPAGGFAAPAAPPPEHWGRREPIGAIVLIGLGILFLLGQLNIFQGRFVEFAWPLLLIALGVWLILRRLKESQGGSK